MLLQDMWHAYNLIATGDRVRATAVRKVQRETATGTVGAEKIKFDAFSCSVLDLLLE